MGWSGLLTASPESATFSTVAPGVWLTAYRFDGKDFVRLGRTFHPLGGPQTTGSQPGLPRRSGPTVGGAVAPFLLADPAPATAPRNGSRPARIKLPATPAGAPNK